MAKILLLNPTFSLRQNMWGWGESTVNRGKAVMQIYVVVFCTDKFLEIRSPLPGSEGDTRTNVNVFYKG